MPTGVEKEEKKKKKEKGRDTEQKGDGTGAGRFPRTASPQGGRQQAAQGWQAGRTSEWEWGGWDFKGSPSLLLSQPAGPVLDKLMTLSSDLSSTSHVNATYIEHRQRDVVNEEEITLTYCS